MRVLLCFLDEGVGWYLKKMGTRVKGRLDIVPHILIQALTFYFEWMVMIVG